MQNKYNQLNYICSQCGAEVDLEKYVMKHSLTQEMLSSKRCSKCSHLDWTKTRILKWENREIINGKVIICHDAPIGMNLNSPNPRGYIMRNDGTVEGFYRAWCPLTIPNELRPLFPDTARFISYKVYRKIKSRQSSECHAIGCYDRYHCYWYHPEKMEKNGPWNVVPEDHKVGDECCEGFIDKNRMFNLKY